MDALTETERRTREKFERQESARGSFTATAECVALCKELAPRLAEVERASAMPKQGVSNSLPRHGARRDSYCEGARR
jgi:hypothetical protein